MSLKRKMTSLAIYGDQRSKRFNDDYSFIALISGGVTLDIKEGLENALLDKKGEVEIFPAATYALKYLIDEAHRPYERDGAIAKKHGREFDPLPLQPHSEKRGYYRDIEGQDARKEMIRVFRAIGQRPHSITGEERKIRQIAALAEKLKNTKQIERKNRLEWKPLLDVVTEMDRKYEEYRQRYAYGLYDPDDDDD